MALNFISNANVYIDGNNLMGRAEEVALPLLKSKSVEHKALGMAGGVKLWAGFDTLEAMIKWNSLYTEALAFVLDHFAAHQFQVMGSLDQYLSQGRVAQLPVIYLMTGRFEDSGTLVFRQQEAAEQATKIVVTHSELYVGGRQQHLYDVFANIYTVNGVDQLARFRQNLGL